MLNILVLGLGQCGNRILDAMNREAFGRGGAFAKYYTRQKFPASVKTIAINTAINDLKGLVDTRAKDRLHVPHLHGVGANRTLGKRVFEDNKEIIMSEIDKRGAFDLIFIITSAAGGSGSSFAPLLVRELKETYTNAPVICIAVLPFREEGSIFLQNAAFCLKDLVEEKPAGVLLVDNQYLKKYAGDIKSAYDKINTTTARRLLFLIEALNSEMLMVTDLGDLKTVMNGGIGIGTMGFYEASKDSTIKSAILGSLKPSGLLFPTNVYKEGARAMLIIKGDKKYLDLDLITKTIEELSTEVGQVFKGVLIQKGRPRVLSLFTLNSVPELEKLYATAAEAIRFEKERQNQSKSQLDSAFSHIEDLEPIY
ncbi:MAG: cell division protein FtsZ [Methanosarcinales archaeon]|nr:cell division protein FtsZ [Methanosarcinales archaeon]